MSPVCAALPSPPPGLRYSHQTPHQWSLAPARPSVPASIGVLWIYFFIVAKNICCPPPRGRRPSWRRGPRSRRGCRSRPPAWRRPPGRAARSAGTRWRGWAGGCTDWTCHHHVISMTSLSLCHHHTVHRTVRAHQDTLSCTWQPPWPSPGQHSCCSSVSARKLPTINNQLRIKDWG